MAEYTRNPLWVDELSDTEHPSNKPARRHTHILSTIGVSAVVAVGLATVLAPFYELYGSHIFGHLPHLDPTLPHSDSSLPPTTPTPAPIHPTEAPVTQPAAETPKVDPKSVAPAPTDPLPPKIEYDPNDPKIEKPEFRPRVPQMHFASDDAYETAKLNLGGIDTDGDGTPDGIAAPARIEDPTDEQVAALQGTGGKGLTGEQAYQALIDGGYKKDGVTYEIWESKTHPGTFYTTPVNEGHELLQRGVVDADTPIVTPDAPEAETPSTVERTVVSDVEPLSFDEDFQQTFGYTDIETGRVITPEEGLMEMLDDQGSPYHEFFLRDKNPWNPHVRQYDEWQIIHDFMMRHHPR